MALLSQDLDECGFCRPNGMRCIFSLLETVYKSVVVLALSPSAQNQGEMGSGLLVSISEEEASACMWASVAYS